MNNSNTNKTILFTEKKKQIENNRENNHLNNTKKNQKSAKIISLSNYKRLKFKKQYIKKEAPSKNKKSKLNIDVMKKRVFLIVIVALFLILFATTAMKQKSYSELPSNTFVAQNTQINSLETSTYKSISKKIVRKYTNSTYKVEVSRLHRNGILIYSQGYFEVPNEGQVNYDLILKDELPISLIINGKEYIK